MLDMELWYPRYGTVVDESIYGTVVDICQIWNCGRYILDMELWQIYPRYGTVVDESQIWNCGRYMLDMELCQIYPRYGTVVDICQIWNCVRYILDNELWLMNPRYGTLLDESQIWNRLFAGSRGTRSQQVRRVLKSQIGSMIGLNK